MAGNDIVLIYTELLSVLRTKVSGNLDVIHIFGARGDMLRLYTEDRDCAAMIPISRVSEGAWQKRAKR